jgi:hypothetical protein
MKVYWSVLPWPFSYVSLYFQGAWSAEQNPGQLITLPEPPKMGLTATAAPAAPATTFFTNKTLRSGGKKQRSRKQKRR